MQKLNTTAVYILSVVGFLCCCVGLGFIPSLIALIIANSGLKKYKANPEDYSNGNSMKTARTVAIIVLVLSIIVTLYTIYMIYQITSNPEFACEFYSNIIENSADNPMMTPEGLEIYENLRDEACSKVE